MTSRRTPLKGDRLTLFAADSLAKTSALPAEKPASKKALGQVSFTNSCESFAWWSQDSSSWKTSQRSLLTGWTSFSESWPRQGLILGMGMHSSKCCGGLSSKRSMVAYCLCQQHRSFGQDLSLPGMRRQDEGRKAGLGNRQVLGSQRWSYRKDWGESLTSDWRLHVSKPCLPRGDDGLSIGWTGKSPWQLCSPTSRGDPPSQGPCIVEGNS